MGKDVIRKMLEKDPETRIGLLEFMDLPYYSIDDAVLQREIDIVTQERNKIEAAEEEKRNQEQLLVQ